jgi:hypothetical protein
LQWCEAIDWAPRVDVEVSALAVGQYRLPLAVWREMIKTYPLAAVPRGSQGPIPGALGNRDLVVVVGVANVNLAGLNVGDPVLGDRATGEDFWSTPNRFGFEPNQDFDVCEGDSSFF